MLLKLLSNRTTSDPNMAIEMPNDVAILVYIGTKRHITYAFISCLSGTLYD